ncbi:hypothetical protein B484DRAFT_442031 [Ochromonadaceae sp. CCMP2298]|nr:hypothetical protein B484DRAFT_442031 [Ochromonadaceae sp. CCMP2298]
MGPLEKASWLDSSERHSSGRMTLSSSPSMRYALRLCVKRTPPVSRSSASCLIWRSISAASSSSLRSAALHAASSSLRTCSFFDSTSFTRFFFASSRLFCCSFSRRLVRTSMSNILQLSNWSTVRLWRVGGGRWGLGLCLVLEVSCSARDIPSTVRTVNPPRAGRSKL